VNDAPALTINQTVGGSDQWLPLVLSLSSREPRAGRASGRLLRDRLSDIADGLAGMLADEPP